MADSNLDLTPPQLADQHTLPPARTLTVEDTPTHWTLPAVVAWILARALSAVLELCEPLPADPIARGARRLRGHKVLWALASRVLGIDAEQALTNKAIDAAVRKARADHAAGKLTDKEAWYRAHQDDQEVHRAIAARG